MQNRDGKEISAQISKMGTISLNGQNFKMDGYPFQLKNDADTPITLEVNLYGMEQGSFIETSFDSGWNPEIIREIKATSKDTNLKWGY